MPFQCSHRGLGLCRMPRRGLLVFVAALPLVASHFAGGRGGNLRASPAPAPQAVDLVNYKLHGQEWTSGACASRDYQSPVNFDRFLKDPPTGDLPFHYEPIRNKNLTMKANHGILHVDFSDEMVGGVVQNGELFPLVRIDFHAKAEHTLKGERLPLEIQLVHRKLNDPKRWLILSILVWCEMEVPPPPVPHQEYFPPDAAVVDFNKNLQKFLFYEPPYQDGTSQRIPIEDEPLDLNELVFNPLIPDTKDYIMYPGSLTQPPCMEHVTWYIRRHKMIASTFQVQALANSIELLTGVRDGNYRALMPINQRQAAVIQAIPKPLASSEFEPMPLGPEPRNDDERRAELFVHYTRDLARQSSDYVHDFANRLKTAAQAHADAFGTLRPTTSPPPPTTTPVEVAEAKIWTDAIYDIRKSVYNTAVSTGNGMKAVMTAQGDALNAEAVKQAAIANAMTAGIGGSAAAPSPAPMLAAPTPASAPGAR